VPSSISEQLWFGKLEKLMHSGEVLSYRRPYACAQLICAVVGGDMRLAVDAGAPTQPANVWWNRPHTTAFSIYV